jgi:hypothetical protein
MKNKITNKLPVKRIKSLYRFKNSFGYVFDDTVTSGDTTVTTTTIVTTTH